MRLIAVMRLGLLAAVFAIVSAGCGASVESGRSVEPVRATTMPEALRPTVTHTGGPLMSAPGMESPPPYRLRFAGQELVLRPHTWCYRSGCVDGFAQEPPSVGSPAVIRVRVPVDGWDLQATFTPSGHRCGRNQTVRPVKRGGWFVLRPAGHAGRYDVELFSQGAGDLIAAFRWKTTADGALPVPEARLAVIAGSGGRPVSYGVELALQNLATTPRSAQARVTVTAANGRSLRFAATRDPQRCWPEGTVYFDGPDGRGHEAAALGGFPFRYEVTVTLGGRVFRASATYPADEIQGNEPSVALQFSPPLPALD
jgi:hypothetical protein